MHGITRSPVDLGGDQSIVGIVTASDYSVTESDLVTLSFEDQSIAGTVTASDYSVTEGSSVTLEYQAVTNTIQWIDENGDDVDGETGATVEWPASLTEQPYRARVINTTTGKSKIFRVDQPIVVTEDPGISGLPSQSALGVWFASEYEATRKAIPNKVVGGTIPQIYTRNPRGMFDTGKYLSDGGNSGWINQTGLTLTEKYATGRDGVLAATRAQFASSATGYVKYRATLSIPAGTYTIVVDCWVTSGTADFQMSKDGYSTSVTKTATTTKQQFKFEFVILSTTSCTLGFCRPVGGVAGDFIIDKAYLWIGPESTVPDDVALGGHLYFGDTEAASVSCTGGELALTNQQQGTLDFDAVSTTDEVTLLVCAKRSGDYIALAGAGRQPFLYTPMEGSHSLSGGIGIGEIDAENELFGVHGSGRHSVHYASKRVSTGTSPNLFANGNYHVLAFRSKSDAITLWVDDCETVLIPTNAPAAASPTLNWRRMCVGGNIGLGRHKVSSMAVYDRYLTEAELKQAVTAMHAEATSNGLTVESPKNYLLIEGDSITVGPSANSYAQQFLANSTATGFTVYNIAAAAGSMLSLNGVSNLNLSTRVPYHLEGIPADLTGRRAIASFMFGANDLDSYTVAAYLAELYSYTDQFRAKGVKVVICTSLPKGTSWSGYAAFNVKQAAIAAQLRLDEGIEFDVLVDFDTSGFDPNTDTSDGLHPTASVHTTKLEPVFRAAINSLFI